MEIRWLHEPAAADSAHTGDRVAVLSRLPTFYPIPSGFVLTATAPAGEEAVAELMRAVLEAYRLLAERLGTPAPAVAVSAPGQHTTELNLIGPDALTAALGRCLSGEGPLAILVQQFITAESAGVAFSISPQTGSRSEVLINATWGIGKSQGRSFTPDQYRVSRAGFAVLESRLAEKEQMRVAVEGGTATVDVPRFLRREPVLTEEQQREVAQLALALEGQMGHPVEFEFAYGEEQIWLLQVRPITGPNAAPPQAGAVTLTPPPDFPVTWDSPEDQGRYWEHDTGFCPDQVLPLFAAFMEPHAEAFMSENPQTLCRYRRIHTYLYKHLSGQPDGPSAPEPPSPTAAQLETLWNGETLPEIQGHCLQLASTDFVSLPNHAMRPQLDELVARYTQIWELHWRVVNPANRALRQYLELYQELFHPTDRLEPLQTLQALPNKAMESNRGLWQLSRRVREDLRLLIIFQESPPGEVMVRLRAGLTGAAWLGELRAYLERYGRRFELYDWSRPSWLEQPGPAVHAVQAFLAKPAYHPDEAMDRLVAERQSLIATARHRLAGYPRPVRERFEGLLQAAQAATVLMEDHNFWIDHRCMYEVRRALLTLGQRFAQRGVLEQAGDLWYLSLTELRQAATDGALPGARALVAERKRELERWAGTARPRELGTRPPQAVEGVSPEAEPGLLRGVPGSAGVVQGRARVVGSLAEVTFLQPGEVLVMPTLAPNWTPIFALAAAVVTEGGGPLSHGAILAREYRLPAVLGVADATRLIPHGAMLEVDGRAGLVRIL